MRLHDPRDLGRLIKDARRRQRLNQSELADRTGVSRQWISLVENGKTSVEFHLVVRLLSALGYRLHAVSDMAREPGPRPDSGHSPTPTHVATGRPPLTRRGRFIGAMRTLASTGSGSSRENE